MGIASATEPTYKGYDMEKVIKKSVAKSNKVTKTQLEYMRDRDKELRRGIFRFYECQGGSMSFVHKAYEGDKVERYDLLDGQAYELPRGVIRHLNTNGWYPVHGHALADDGRPSMKISQKVRRFGFESTEFSMDDDMQPNHSNIIGVEAML